MKYIKLYEKTKLPKNIFLVEGSPYNTHFIHRIDSVEKGKYNITQIYRCSKNGNFPTKETYTISNLDVFDDTVFKTDTLEKALEYVEMRYNANIYNL